MGSDGTPVQGRGSGAKLTPQEVERLFELSLIHISEPTRPY